MSGKHPPPCHSLVAFPLNKQPGTEMMPVSRLWWTISTFWHYRDHCNTISSFSTHAALKRNENEGFMKKQSLLDANFRQKQLFLLPLVDFFRISARCKLLIYSSASFRPIGEEIFNHLICHLGLFPEELVEIEWPGSRDCQEMLYRVQKHLLSLLLSPYW